VLPILTLLLSTVPYRTVLPVRSVQAGLPSKALSLWTRRGTALRYVIQVSDGDTDGWPFWEWKVMCSNHTIPEDAFEQDKIKQDKLNAVYATEFVLKDS
jgi:hypothetical protein